MAWQPAITTINATAAYSAKMTNMGQTETTTIRLSRDLPYGSTVGTYSIASVGSDVLELPHSSVSSGLVVARTAKTAAVKTSYARLRP